MIKSHSISQSESRIRAVTSVVTFIVGIVVLLVKFWAFNVSHSQSIYSDALESIVNVLTAVVGILVVYYASKPADDDHPYGHGKAEYFSSVFEGGLITFAAVIVFVEVIKAHVNQEPLRDLSTGSLLLVIAGVINLVWGLLLKKIGHKYASPTLESAGVHLILDFWTTAGALIGVLLVTFTKVEWIDRLVAVLLGSYMAFSGLNLMRLSMAGLLDAEDLKILQRLADLFEKHAGAGIIQIHHAKVIRSGWFHHIDAHVVVPEFWTIDKAHDVLDVFEEKVINEYEFGGEANFHLDPCKRKYCTVCDYKECQVRTEPFQARIPVVIEHLRSKTEPQ